VTLVGAIEEEGDAEEKCVAFFLNPTTDAIPYFLNPDGTNNAGGAPRMASFIAVAAAGEQQALGANFPVSGSLPFHCFSGLVISDGGGGYEDGCGWRGRQEEWRWLRRQLRRWERREEWKLSTKLKLIHE